MRPVLTHAAVSAFLICTAPASASITGTLAVFVRDVLANVAGSVVSDVVKDTFDPASQNVSIAPANANEIDRTRKIINIITSESVPLSEKIGLYATSVDYFKSGVVNHSFIVKDRKRYEARWPSRRFDLISIDQIGVATDKSYVVARYTLKFIVSRPGDTRQGFSHVAVLIGSFDSQPRIHSIKEWVER